MRKIHSFFFVFVCSLSTIAGTLPGDLYDIINCRSVIEKTLSPMKIDTFKWRRVAESVPGERVFRAPLKKFGKWIEVHSSSDPKAYLFSNKKTKVYKWDGKTCKIKIKSDAKPLNITKVSKKDFSDKQLKVLLDSKENIFIYIWSSGMIYSFKEMKNMERIVKKAGLKFLPLHFYKDDKKEIKKIIKNFKLGIKSLPMRSLDLYLREAHRHFPVSYVVSKGAISKKIFGVQTEEILLDKIKKALVETQVESRRNRNE